ncbi:MAG: hypothetical protein AB1Z98_34920 [Nannocystaceae bacterium]
MDNGKRINQVVASLLCISVGCVPSGEGTDRADRGEDKANEEQPHGNPLNFFSGTRLCAYTQNGKVFADDSTIQPPATPHFVGSLDESEIVVEEHGFVLDNIMTSLQGRKTYEDLIKVRPTVGGLPVENIFTGETSVELSWGDGLESAAMFKPASWEGAMFTGSSLDIEVDLDYPYDGDLLRDDHHFTVEWGEGETVYEHLTTAFKQVKNWDNPIEPDHEVGHMNYHVEFRPMSLVYPKGWPDAGCVTDMTPANSKWEDMIEAEFAEGTGVINGGGLPGYFDDPSYFGECEEDDQSDRVGPAGDDPEFALVAMIDSVTVAAEDGGDLYGAMVFMHSGYAAEDDQYGAMTQVGISNWAGQVSSAAATMFEGIINDELIPENKGEHADLASVIGRVPAVTLGFLLDEARAVRVVLDPNYRTRTFNAEAHIPQPNGGYIVRSVVFVITYTLMRVRTNPTPGTEQCYKQINPSS